MGRSQVRDSKRYAVIAKQIRDWIEAGELRPGDRLPPLAELAEQFSCSRATIREALSTLRGQGLVEFRHGDGTYVRTANVEMWMEPLDAALLLATGHVQQLMELMTVLLAGMAGVAAQRRDEADLAKLAQALFRLECAEPQAEDAVLAEVGFYLTLSECTGNVLFENVVRVLQEALRSCLRLVQGVRPTGIVTCRALFDAVKSGDVSLARTVAYEFGDFMAQSIAVVREAAQERPTS
jgi:GntR family transcriptional regulator, transcriptional repressor for pyruvate dehydrogenase complex